MAVTQNTYTGNGSTVLFSFTFPYLETTDVKVSLNGTVTTAYTFANATTIQFNTAPANGVAIRIYRQTDDSELSATFYPGSAIRSQDLNDNFTQNLYVTQEVNNNAVDIDGSNPMAGNLNLNNFKVVNLATPTVATDASTKGYVDSVVATGAANAAAAAASASAAAGSATAAANSFDAFDDRYLGVKASDPAVDNDGNALITGAMYFNSTTNRTKVYNGTIWIDAGVPGSLVRWTKTAAGGETSLSGNDNNSNALNYTPGSEQVFLNGALLTRGVDYTATTGTTITGLVALTTGDVVDVQSLNQYVVGTVPDQSVTNAKVANAANIASSKLSFTQAGTGAVARTVDSKLKDVVSVKDFGAVGDGVADDTAAIQAAVTHCMQNSYGGTVYFPSGLYKVTTTINLDRSSNPSLGRVSIKGSSQESVRVFYSGGGSACFYIANAQSGGLEPNASYQSITDLTILGANNKQTNSSGITINLGAFAKLERLNIGGFDNGLYLQDTDQLYAEKLTLRYNNNGIVVRKNPSPGVASTQPNNHTYVSCAFANNSNSGGTWIGGSDINFFGGDVEYNGSDANGFGLKFLNCGYEGGRGANIQGVYIEGNRGIADIILEATAVEYAPLLSVVHQVSASFKRLSGSNNTTNHILCAFGSPSTVGTQSLLLTGSSFRTYPGYTPNASNKVVAYSITPASSSNFYDIGSFYESSVEKPAFWQSLNKFDACLIKATAQTFTSGVEAQWAIDTVVSPGAYPLWVPDLSTNTVTIPQSGTYNIAISLVLSTPTAGQKMFVIRKNGNLIGIFTSDTALNVFTNSFITRLAAGDVLSFSYKQSTGAPQDIMGSNTFTSLNIAKVF